MRYPEQHTVKDEGVHVFPLQADFILLQKGSKYNIGRLFKCYNPQVSDQITPLALPSDCRRFRRVVFIGFIPSSPQNRYTL